jgi:hypothetical protein
MPWAGMTRAFGADTGLPIFFEKETVQGVARIAFPECLKHYPE